MADNIKVAVRVRPFNKRQLDLKSTLVVDMEGPSTKLLPYNKDPLRTFTFDYSFWSFDNFVQQSDGYLRPTSPKYSDQKKVFELLGSQVLNNTFKGFNCTLFAYGQTGSGKTYSTIGFGQNKGIVPITFQNIFTRIKKNADPNLIYDVKISMIQIYNQIIQDLLIPIDKRPPKGLQIRESPKLGVFIEGARKIPVINYEGIAAVMEDGTKNRSVAATQMNAFSSRAHTIIQLQFTQITKGPRNSQKSSIINLVDLAGSQRQSKSGAEGKRLKQAAGINLSLSTLGLVISALAQQSEGKKVFVPYRNSSLTRVLQNGLGGNSHSIMICAISPSNDNYQQTLSTLRYADQAKKIKNKPKVNQCETDKLIKELKEENERLKKLLAEANVEPNSVGSTSSLNQQMKNNLSSVQETNKRIKELQLTEEERFAEWKKQQQRMNNQNQQIFKRLKEQQDKLKKTNEQLKQIKIKKLAQAEAQARANAKAKANSTTQIINDEDLIRVREHAQKKMAEEIALSSHHSTKDSLDLCGVAIYKMLSSKPQIPFLENVNRDYSISNKLIIYLSKLKTTVGKSFSKQFIDIVVNGIDVKTFHCVLVNDNGKVYLVPKDYGSVTYVNGFYSGNIQRLYHMDRVVFGWNSCFIFKDFSSLQTRPGVQVPKKIDWELFRTEMPVDIQKQDIEQQGGCCSIM